MICWFAEKSWYFQTTGKVNIPAWTFKCLLSTLFRSKGYECTFVTFQHCMLLTVQSLPWVSQHFRVSYISRWVWAAVSAVEQQSLSGQGCVILHWVCDVFNLQNLNQQCWVSSWSPAQVYSRETGREKAPGRSERVAAFWPWRPLCRSVNGGEWTGRRFQKVFPSALKAECIYHPPPHPKGE